MAYLACVRVCSIVCDGVIVGMVEPDSIIAVRVYSIVSDGV